MKKNIIIIFAILFFSIFLVNAFQYSERPDGSYFYESHAEIKVPLINVKNLFILNPSSEPVSPELGMIYLDSNSKRLKFYDGTGWYSIALEKVSSISKKQVQEIVEKKNELLTCEISIECGEWGDCINNYQSMICVTTEENCDKSEDTETRDCISEDTFELSSIAKESHKPDKEIIEEETEEVEEVEEIPEESEEEIPEALFDITFDIEEKSLGETDKLITWITLQNFGKRYVPARIIYSVLDKDGKEIYQTFQEVRVYTDESIIKRFDDLILEEGNYKIIIEIEYAGIVEKFEDDFSVQIGLVSFIRKFLRRLF